MVRVSDPTPSSSSQIGDRFEVLARVARTVQSAGRSLAGGDMDLNGSVRQIARRLAVSPNLAWKLLRIVHAEHAAEIIAAIPGDRGAALLLNALEASGRNPDGVTTLQLALEEYRGTLDRLAIDTRELAVMAGGGLTDAAMSRSLARAAKRIVEGYTELCGHRIDLALVGAIAFPSADQDGMLDLVGYELYHGVTRLRPGGPIRLRNAAWARAHDLRVASADDDLSVLAEASTPDLEQREIMVVRDETESAIYVDPNSSRVDPITIAFIQVHRGLGLAVPEPEKRRRGRRRLGYQINCSPVRHALVEYQQCRELPPISLPAATIDLTFTRGATLESTVPYDRIPIDLPVRSASPTLPAAVKSAADAYDALLAAAAARAGTDRASLVGHRVLHQHPPMSSALTLTWEPAHGAL